jgi:hypothetical protein
MLKQLLLPFLLFHAVFSFAQKKIDITDNDVDVRNFFRIVSGEPISLARYSKLVEGTPYFNKDWMSATLTMSKGKEYSNIPIKLNLLDNEVHYRDPKGVEMIAATPMKKIVLTDPVTSENYTFINARFLGGADTNKDEWYQLLSEGNVSVVKQHTKKLYENTPFNSGVIEQTITTTPQYFVLNNNQLIQAKKLKDVPDIFPVKKAELLQYINDKKLNGKRDEDFVSVINYYNSLK